MNQQLLTAGQEFAGRYRIERFLAEGGFGAVYVAEQLATEARVALKVLWPHVLGSKDAVEKFEQEARIAGRVNSDHIVRVIDAGFEQATQMPFLVMELLIGEDLNSLVERQGALPPELVVEYLRQVASALDRAHSYTDREGARRPIVHRDLKPENIFLSRRENGDPLVKVLDFGIAKVTSSTSNISREVKGTPLFMAYEQAAGGAITPQTDVWPLGLIAVFLLTGMSYWRTAHSAEGSLAQLFGEVLTLPLDPPSTRLAELGRPGILPPGFDAWFSRCVNRDPSQRYATAGEAIMMLGDAYGIVIQTVGSRPTSNVVLAQTPPSLAVPTHVTPLHASPTGASPLHATPAGPGTASPVEPTAAPQGPTLQSAREPTVAATQGALSISGTGAAPKKGMLPTLLLVAGALVFLGGIGAIGFVVKGGGSASADPATGSATGSVEPPSANEPPVPTLLATPSPSLAPEAPSAAPTATAAPAAAKTSSPAPKPTTAPSAKLPTPTTTAPPSTAPTAKPKPTENVYEGR